MGFLNNGHGQMNAFELFLSVCIDLDRNQFPMLIIRLISYSSWGGRVELQGNANKSLPDRDSDSADGADVALSSSIYHCLIPKVQKQNFTLLSLLALSLSLAVY